MQKIKVMLSTRIFWAALVGVLMVMAKAAVPAFQFDSEALTQVLYVIGAYIFGEAFEGNQPIPGGWSDVLRSRKFWASIVGVGMVLLHAFFPALVLDEVQIVQMVWVFVTFIAGMGIADRMAKDDRQAVMHANG
jgi:hypothetical protein